MSENYRRFKAEDFAEDISFIRWVMHPDQESDLFWNTFIKDNPDKQADIQKARKIVSALNFKAITMDEASFSAMRDGLLSAIESEEGAGSSAGKDAPTGRRRVLRFAAVFALFAVALGSYYSADDASSKESNALATTPPESDDIPTEEQVTPRGRKSVLVLPDGSKVWLNVDSKLTYTKDYKRANKREVQLEGEAFFDVVRNDSVPFIVHTASSIRIEVLGTSFNVKSYNGDQTVETTLVNGKVSIDKLEKNGLTVGNLILKPNQRAVYVKESKILNVEPVDAQNVSAWRHDNLVFDETPFTDVLAQLERWYDVRIHLMEDDGHALPCTLTANIQRESLEDVLKLLKTSHRIGYSIRDREVYIYGKPCKN